MLPLNNSRINPQPLHNAFPIPHYANENNYQQLLPKQKLNSFRLEIRNNQIKQMKSKIRSKMIESRQFKELFDNIPKQNWETHRWARQILQLQSPHHQLPLTSDQCLELYWLVQKFPNRTTFELLQLIISRASNSTLDVIFQYDIMKLLHSAIMFNKNMRPLPISTHYEPSQQPISSYHTIQKINHSMSEYATYEERLGFVRSSLKIISEICRRDSMTRNFAILNNKTLNYWNQALKQFGVSVKIQYCQALYSACFFNFCRNEQQFSKIQSKILSIFCQQKYDLLLLTQQQLHQKVQEVNYIYLALKKLIYMGYSWFYLKIQYYESKFQAPLIRSIITLIKQFNCLLKNDISKVTKSLCQMVNNGLEVIKIYSQKVDQHKINSNIKNERGELGFELVSILISGVNIPFISDILANTFFLLSNLLHEQNITKQAKQSFVILNTQKPNQNLLYLLYSYLTPEEDFIILSEIAYLLSSIFRNIHLTILEPVIIPSQIIQAMTCKVIEGSYSQHKIINTKVNLLECLIIFFSSLEDFDLNMAHRYKSNFRQQFQIRLQQVASHINCDSILEQKIVMLLRTVQSNLM